MTVRLATTFGRRVFLLFGLATMIVVAILVVVSVASRSALKRYSDEQLARLPWDFVLYQNEVGSSGQARTDIATSPHVSSAEDLYLLRLVLPPDVVPQVDGRPLGSPFLSLLAATDPELLPPTLRPPSDDQAVLALIGPESRMGSAFQALQGATSFELRIPRNAPVPRDQTARRALSLPPPQPPASFKIGLARTVRMDRTELNRWFTDKTNTPSFIPDIGAILAIPHNFDVVAAFDNLGESVEENGEEAELRQDPGHVESGSYFPEVLHLIRLDRPAVISGWDIRGSNKRLAGVEQTVQAQAADAGVPPVANSMSGVLLAHIEQTGRLLDVISALIALPLLWVAWLFLGRLARLLLLNERRVLGLMRLRGVPGGLAARAMLAAIAAGSIAGGLLGLVIATACAVVAYAQAWLPWDVLFDIEKPWMLVGFFAVGVATALLSGWGLVRLARTASPIDASAHVMPDETQQEGLVWWPVLALLVGGFKVVGWATGATLVSVTGLAQLGPADVTLNFLGLPLFVYGVASFLALNQRFVMLAVAATPRVIAGQLKPLWLHHLSLKPHRLSTFLVIMALMASVSLYPTVIAGSFGDKAVRGAMVGTGAELGFTLNTPDVVDARQLSGPLAKQQDAIRQAVTPVLARISAQTGVEGVDYISEYLLSSIYMPGEGFRSLPLYVLEDARQYLGTVYHENGLGVEQPFDDILLKLDEGKIAVSPALADFWSLGPGSQLLLGTGADGQEIRALVAGTIRFLPGRPLQTITYRESYAASQVDYLNFLFDNSAFLVAAASNADIASLTTAAPRIAMVIKLRPGVNPDAARKAVVAALPAAPLETRLLDDEIQKIGSDMFIDLGLENVRIYLVGGLALALAGMLSVAAVNYAEDRRTLALLRIRGARRLHVAQLVGTTLLAPATTGLVLGSLAALAAGYGMTNMIWSLREIHSFALMLATRVKVTGGSGLIVLTLGGVIAALTYGLSAWAFRRTARESLSSAGSS